MKISQKIYKLFKNVKARLCCKNIKKPKLIRMYQKPVAEKLPLEYAIDETYSQLMLEQVHQNDLDGFFRWAAAGMMGLDVFFHSAQFLDTPQCVLEKFFYKAEFPETQQYALDTLIEIAGCGLVAQWDLDSFFRLASYEDAPQYELNKFFQQLSYEQATLFRIAEYPEELNYELNALFTEVPAILQAITDENEDFIAKNNDEIAEEPMEDESVESMDKEFDRMETMMFGRLTFTRSFSCSFEAMPRFKRGVTRYAPEEALWFQKMDNLQRGQ